MKSGSSDDSGQNLEFKKKRIRDLTWAESSDEESDSVITKPKSSSPSSSRKPAKTDANRQRRDKKRSAVNWNTCNVSSSSSSLQQSVDQPIQKQAYGKSPQQDRSLIRDSSSEPNLQYSRVSPPACTDSSRFATPIFDDSDGLVNTVAPKSPPQQNTEVNKYGQKRYRENRKILAQVSTLPQPQDRKNRSDRRDARREAAPQKEEEEDEEAREDSEKPKYEVSDKQVFHFVYDNFIVVCKNPKEPPSPCHWETKVEPSTRNLSNVQGKCLTHIKDDHNGILHEKLRKKGLTFEDRPRIKIRNWEAHSELAKDAELRTT